MYISNVNEIQESFKVLDTFAMCGRVVAAVGRTERLRTVSGWIPNHLTQRILTEVNFLERNSSLRFAFLFRVDGLFLF